MAGPRRPRGLTEPLNCHDRALRLLAVRPRSRRELEVRLLRAGFESQEVAEELVRLESVGLLDDERFARAVVEHELSVRRGGRRGAASALMAKGVDRGTIERVVAETSGSDAERAAELAASRAPRLAGLPSEKAYQRLVAFLVRRGHEPETARRAARSALVLDPSEE